MAALNDRGGLRQCSAEHPQYTGEPPFGLQRVDELAAAIQRVEQRPLALVMLGLDELLGDRDEGDIRRHAEQGEVPASARVDQIIRDVVDQRVGPKAERRGAYVAEAGGERTRCDPLPVPDAGGEDDLVTAQVGRGIGHVAGMHPADDAVKIALNDQLQSQLRAREELANGERHPAGS